MWSRKSKKGKRRKAKKTEKKGEDRKVKKTDIIIVDSLGLQDIHFAPAMPKDASDMANNLAWAGGSSTYADLKRSAAGGGIKGERFDYAFNFLVRKKIFRVTTEKEKNATYNALVEEWKARYPNYAGSLEKLRPK